MNKSGFHLYLLQRRVANLSRNIRIYRRSRFESIVVPKSLKLFDHFVGDEPDGLNKALEKAVEYYGLVPKVVISKQDQDACRICNHTCSCIDCEKKNAKQITQLRRKLKLPRKSEKRSDIDNEVMVILFKNLYNCHTRFTRNNGYLCTITLRSKKFGDKRLFVAHKKMSGKLVKMTRRACVDRAARKAFLSLEIMDRISSVDLENALTIKKMHHTIKLLDNRSQP